MKLVAGILLICFFYLMAQPMALHLRIPPVDSSQKECCMACSKHKKHLPAAPTQKGCCGDLNCNPFAQYSCCSGFILSNHQANPLFFAGLIKVEPATIPAFIQDFCSGCFHPPEMV